MHSWLKWTICKLHKLQIILLVGAKLQVIITKMGLRIQERGDVVKGAPLVQPGDDLFWFGRPGFLLFLIHAVLFQNAFQLAFFAWSTVSLLSLSALLFSMSETFFLNHMLMQFFFFLFFFLQYEFNLKSCFHKTNEDIAIRVSMGWVLRKTRTSNVTCLYIYIYIFEYTN